MEKPQFVILAGPNGAGKTTCAGVLLPPDVPFMNADEIAKGLAGFEGIAQDLRASRHLLERISTFESDRRSFALETNLSNRGLLQRITRLRELGYSVTLIFLWLRSVDLAIDRVMERVRRGGHSVPAEVVKRRYRIGLENFLKFYQSKVDAWFFFDNSSGDAHLVASRDGNSEEIVYQVDLWNALCSGSFET